MTAEAVSSAPVGEGGFRLLADQLPDLIILIILIILAFDPQPVMWASQRRLIAVRGRVEALGGRFRVATAPGQGTVIEARLPLTDPAERWGA